MADEDIRYCAECRCFTTWSVHYVVLSDGPHPWDTWEGTTMACDECDEPQPWEP